MAADEHSESFDTGLVVASPAEVISSLIEQLSLTTTALGLYAGDLADKLREVERSIEETDREAAALFRALVSRAQSPPAPSSRDGGWG